MRWAWIEMGASEGGFEHIASPPWAANDGTFRATKPRRFWHISIVGVTSPLRSKPLDERY